MTYDPEAQKNAAEQEGKKESQEATLFDSPDAAEKMKAAAAAEVSELEAGGIPAAERIAAQTGAPLDAETKAELGAIGQEALEAKAELDVAAGSPEAPVTQAAESKDGNGEKAEQEAIAALNAFLEKYGSRLAAGEELSALGLPEDVLPAIRKHDETLRDIIRTAPERAESIIDAVHPMMKPDLIGSVARDLSSRDPAAAFEFHVRKSEQSGAPLTDEERTQLREGYQKDHDRYVPHEMEAKIDAAIASGQWEELAAVAADHGEKLSKDTGGAYAWRSMTEKFVKAAVAEIGKMIASDLGAAIEAYRQLPEGSPVSSAVRFEVYEAARQKMPFDERLGFLMSETETASEANSERTLAALHEKHGKEKVDALIGAIDESKFFSINLHFDRISQVLEDDRFKSSWETGDRAYLSHVTRRDSYERILGIRAGAESDPHPAYGAVGFDNGKDTDAGPSKFYGDCQLQLKRDVVEKRAMFLYGDLGDTGLGDHRSRQFSYKDAAVAKAKVELDGETDYVEMQVLGGVRLEDIDRIVIPKKHEKDQAEKVSELRARYPGVEIVFE